MSKSIRAMMGIATVAVVFVAGCANTVAGSAEPNAAALSAAALSGAPASPSVDPGPPTSGGTASSSGPQTSAPSPTPSGEPLPSTSLPVASPPPTAPRTTPSGGPTAGTYPSTPGKYYKNPQTQAGANLLEARRIASGLLPPTLIEPSYNRGGNLSTLPMRGPSAMSILFPPPVPTVAQRAGMTTGFSSARTDPAGTGMVVAAFEFGTAAQAAAAVKPLTAASATRSTDKGAAKLAGLPAAAGWFGRLSDGKFYFQAFAPQGRMVLYVYLHGSAKALSTPAQQAALATKVLNAESASMAKFVPTPPADLMKLLVDPDSMLGHTVPNPDSKSTVLDGLYTAAAQLHFDSDPVNTKVLFAKAGVDEVADGRTSLYRARDAAGATLVRDSLVASTQKTISGMQRYTLTAKVPSARCLQQTLNSTYYCVGVRGRYAFEVNAGSESDVNAAMAAQYTMLAGF